MKYQAILFDFDGVLIESEFVGNRQIAEWLSANGHPTTTQDAMDAFMGLSGPDFQAKLQRRIGPELFRSFAVARSAEDARVLAEGVGEVAGAVAFVRGLPADVKRAVVSSSTTHWIGTHLDHLGLRDAFAPHLYSGREHVARGKPEPDLYLYAAQRLGVPIDACAIIEDSPIGVTGAAKTGAFVIGLCAGSHCSSDHGARLKALGADAVAADFGEVSRLLG